ncbi:MAG: S8/S53 family peptidase [Chloroflexi bacterium]|nr:S8/S53 family peptidase [Chloroflexota bacterium]
MSETPERKHVHYFVPGEMILLIEHKNHDLDQVRQFANQLFDEITPFTKDNDSLDFLDHPSTENDEADSPPNFSLFFARNLPPGLTCNQNREGPGPLFYIDPDVPTDHDSDIISDDRLATCIVDAYERISRGDVTAALFDNSDSAADIKLLPVTLNWIMSGNPHDVPDGAGGGGPGAVPVEDPIGDYSNSGVWDEDKPWSFSRDPLPPGGITNMPLPGLINFLRDRFPSLDDTDDEGRAAQKIAENAYQAVVKVATDANNSVDRKVKVAIFDTCPPTQKMKDAYKELKDKHPLVRSLFEERSSTDAHDSKRPGPFKRLNIWRWPEFGSANRQGSEGLELASACSSCYPFKAYDHGTFIAGIIHTLAPDAELHIFQTLNDWGVGTMETAVTQFKKALDVLAEENTYIIANMSMMFDFPWDEHHLFRECYAYPTPTEDDEGGDGLFGRFRGDQNFVDAMLLPLIQTLKTLLNTERLLANIDNLGGVVVASAGNDGKWDVDDARYPAAYPRVIGVGALDHNFEPAGYSNIADKPLDQGIAAFGGTSMAGTAPAGNPEQGDGKPPQADKTGGMLGVYIGPFPDSALDYKTAYENIAKDKAPGEPLENYLNGGKNNSGWARWSGTSFAAPVVSGFLAQVASRQFKGIGGLLVFRAIVLPAILVNVGGTREEYRLRIKQGE